MQTHIQSKKHTHNLKQQKYFFLNKKVFASPNEVDKNFSQKNQKVNEVLGSSKAKVGKESMKINSLNTNMETTGS